MYSKIFNPVNNKNVNLFSKEGLNIIQKYLQKGAAVASLSPTPSDNENDDQPTAIYIESYEKK